MKVKFLKEDKKTEEVLIEVTLNKEEKSLIKNHFKRKRCTDSLIRRAVIESLDDYARKYEKRGEKNE